MRTFFSKKGFDLILLIPTEIGNNTQTKINSINVYKIILIRIHLCLLGPLDKNIYTSSALDQKNRGENNMSCLAENYWII